MEKLRGRHGRQAPASKRDLAAREPTSSHELRGVLFSVRDFGEGIPKESREKIFDKFYQAEMREMGLRNDTGLGLTFCKMAVELFGGDIWVESEEGKGSRFSFVLSDTL